MSKNALSRQGLNSNSRIDEVLYLFYEVLAFARLTARGQFVKLNRMGVIFGAVYALVFVMLLIATNYLSDYAAQTARLYLVRWPLAFLGLNYFGSDEFWAKYESCFFPVCLAFFYLAGCLIDRVIVDSSGSAGGKRPDVC